MSNRVGRNALFNLAGGAVPAIVALVTIPIIVRGLGEAGYGLFTLITAIVGYFALLDVNVTAGSVKYLAEFSAKGDARSVNETVTFGLIIYSVIGLVGGIAIYVGADFLIGKVFQIPADLRDIAKVSLEISALGFAFGQMQTYFQSIPQALLRYDLTSKLEMSFGIAIPLGTVGLLMAGYGLVEIVALRIVASMLNCVLLWRCIRQLIPALVIARPSRRILNGLIEFSAFSFLSRVAALTYAYADKLIIGSMVGVKELAYYTVAATLANRVLGLMFRISAVFFPTASALVAQNKHARLEELYIKGSRYVGFLNASILILVAAFAEPILRFWIGADFAARGALVLQLIAIAQFVDSLTNMPSLVNDGMGYPRVSGTFALGRALVGLVMIYVLVSAQGIEGAAWAHLGAAMIMTTLFLMYVHGRTVPCSLRNLLTRSYALPMIGIALIGTVTVYFVRQVESGFRSLFAIMLLAVALLCLFGLTLVLLPQDRVYLSQRIRRLFSKRF